MMISTIENCCTPEQKIVLWASGLNIDGQKADAIKALAGTKVDWDKIVVFAKEHGLLFFLYKTLKTACPDKVPHDILLSLKQHYYNNHTRNLALAVRLVKILSLFHTFGIVAVPFKGPVLAEIAYGDIGVRPFSDLDILINPEDVAKTRNLLIENGFLLTTKIPESQLKIYLKHENFLAFFDKKGAITIDLHWEITGRYSLCPVYLQTVSHRLKTIKLVDQDVLSLCFEDMLLYLCIHSTSHCWEKLELICSVAEMIKSGKIVDWVGLEERATSLKCKKMLYLGLALARDLFGAVLSKDIEKKIHAVPSVEKLEKQVFNIIFHSDRSNIEKISWRYSNLHFAVRDKFSDSLLYALRLLFCPTMREWDTYPLPSHFLFLYYIIRPFRLLSGLLKKGKHPDATG